MERLKMLDLNEFFIGEIHTKVSYNIIGRGTMLVAMDREMTVRDLGVPIYAKVGRWIHDQKKMYTYFWGDILI